MPLSFNNVVQRVKKIKKKKEGFPQPSPDNDAAAADDAALVYNDRSPVYDKYDDDDEEAAVAEAIAAAAAAEAAGAEEATKEAAAAAEAAAAEEAVKAAAAAAEAAAAEEAAKAAAAEEADNAAAAAAEAAAAEEAAEAAAAAAAREAAIANMPLEKMGPTFTRSKSSPNYLRHTPPGGGDPNGQNTGDPRWLRSPFLVLLYLGSAVLAFVFLPSHHFTGATKAANRVIDGFYLAVVTFCTVGHGDITPSSPVLRVMSTVFILIGTFFLENPLSFLVSWALHVAKSKGYLVSWALHVAKSKGYKIKVRDSKTTSPFSASSLGINKKC